ncbi:hypothetical protein SPRG_07629 [Saprolegnia parasitica CBS 223.65]|uniref:Uncharacterized protein n=1 Tax=Saprolegnia parasitica (strain CBS 223.65) TaxID=695850 RepID=A0A067CCK1_SAPPC|nr:hypothetical protein SPRG_07629 [Saprolegnia parasitica CBS 223.65]KDO26915.1 hypothetical protein SPRG_07629 [Saprolegnia parasitica CBS 223.65]|eukprot:XP_012202297.1 hypothetical protein SPRG_07629 [Saprolegnia parasitica CBS 223.65]
MLIEYNLKNKRGKVYRCYTKMHGACHYEIRLVVKKVAKTTVGVEVLELNRHNEPHVDAMDVPYRGNRREGSAATTARRASKRRRANDDDSDGDGDGDDTSYGIEPTLRDRIDTSSTTSLGAKSILSRLRSEFLEDEYLSSKMPSYDQVANRRAYSKRRKKGPMDEEPCLV